MKVLLITPPWMLNKYNQNLIDINQPLGLAYLGAACYQAGHDIVIVDSLIENCNPIKRTLTVHRIEGGEYVIYGVLPNNLVGAVMNNPPDVVAMSVNFSGQYVIAKAILTAIKENCPDIITVLGGAHVTVSPMDALSSPAVDYIIQGEGELSFPALLDRITKKQSPAGLPGVGFQTKEGKTILTPFERIKDLDSLPFPLFEAMEMEKYFAMHGKRLARMYTSRGCTFACSFCSVPTTSNRRFLGHSPQRVIKEIEKLISDWQIEEITFEDDNMSLNPKRFKRIFELIVDGDYGLDLSARNFRCDLLSVDDLALMKTAGFQKIWITPETGSQRVMDDLIGKAMKLTDVWQSALNIKAAGLEIAAAFVIGMPGETWAEIEQTATLARRLKDLGATEFWVSVATPIEGSRLYNESINSGLITEMRLDNFTYNRGTLNTAEWSSQELTEYRTKLMDELNDGKVEAN